VADTSKVLKVVLIAGAPGAAGYGVYCPLNKQQAQGGASQTSGQGGTQQSTTGGWTSYTGTSGTSPGSCPTCGGGTTSAPRQPTPTPPPSQPSQPSRPTTTSVPPNINTLIALISGQFKPEAPTPALQVLLGQSTTAQPWLTLGPIKIYF
jgi:hypothetical protein